MGSKKKQGSQKKARKVIFSQKFDGENFNAFEDNFSSDFFKEHLMKEKNKNKKNSSLKVGPSNR